MCKSETKWNNETAAALLGVKNKDTREEFS